MSLSPSSVFSLYSIYLSIDPCIQTRNRMESLWKNHDSSLETRLTTRLVFGTAGLRARMDVGYNCINVLTVLQTTQGVLASMNEEQRRKGAVVGYDARHQSREFAETVASVLMEHGVRVCMYGRVVATPMVPFAVKNLKCGVGIMITASHNPKEDNGYKLYWENGAQIIPPVDEIIANNILLHLKPEMNYVFNANHPFLKNPIEEMEALYYEHSLRHCFHRSENPYSNVKIAFTAMHGVGYYWTKKAFSTFGLPDLVPVLSQVEPDPDFPTVLFPNPEEGKGALQHAIITALKENCSLILANDPDADRLAVAERIGDEFRVFSGNEIACLFADWIFQNHKRLHPNQSFEKCVMLASTVSSKFLASMARIEGFTFVDTLTGFKWMGNVAQQMEARGYTFLFAYEVEIGFLVGNNSYDKDGVRTAAIFAEMANQLYKSGKSCAQHLDDLYKRYGYFAMNTSYFICNDPKILETIFENLRTGNNGDYLRVVDENWVVKDIRDISTGKDTRQSDGNSILPKISNSHMITYWFSNGTTITFRNSGTEPKLKYYVEACHPNSMQEARELVDEITPKILHKFLQPEIFGLIPARKE